VTGATGFVGGHLAERLCREGLRVVCLVRPTSRLLWLEGLAVETRLGSLDEPASLERAVADADYVFHVAGVTRARTQAAYMAANCEGTRRLVEAACRTGRVRRFVQVSSLAAVGPNPTAEPLDEAAEPRPFPGYGASKLAGERAVLDAVDRLPVTVVRPPAVYGPRDENFVSLFRPAHRRGLAPIVGSPAKQVTLVHVADLVECLWLAARADAAVGKAYFVGSGTHAWSEVIVALEAALGRRLRRVRVPTLLVRAAGWLGALRWAVTGKPQLITPRKVRDLLQPRWTCSWAKAERELGYRPSVSLERGMRETAEWYVEHGWLGGRRDA